MNTLLRKRGAVRAAQERYAGVWGPTRDEQKFPNILCRMVVRSMILRIQRPHSREKNIAVRTWVENTAAHYLFAWSPFIDQSGHVGPVQPQAVVALSVRGMYSQRVATSDTVFG